jgi:hypothetical protein
MPTVPTRPDTGPPAADDEPINLVLTSLALDLVHDRAPIIRSRCRPTDPFWLPLQPLRDSMVRRLTIAGLAAMADVATRTACGWVGRDAIPDYAADRVACEVGLHPALIWGRVWWALADEGEVA